MLPTGIQQELNVPTKPLQGDRLWIYYISQKQSTTHELTSDT